MKLFMRYILNLLFWLSVVNNITAQNSNIDSVKILFGEIFATSSTCTGFDQYKKAISQINLDDPEDAIFAVMNADSLFLKANKNRSCSLSKPINRLQAILRKLKHDIPSDITSLNNALLFGKSKSSDETINLQLEFINISNPLVSIQSLDSYILPIRSDSTMADVYLLPGKKYSLTVALSGYNTFTAHVVSSKDTVINISLTEIKATTEPTPPQVKTRRGIGLWWIPITIILIFLIAIAWRIFKNDRLHNNVTQVSIGNTGESVNKLNEKIQNQEVLISKYADEIEQLKSKQTIQPVKPPSGKYFITEIMLTAGPRKKMNVDRDLGEDVSGVVMNDSEALIWLMDGSSDFFDPLLHPETKREYFSSRLLAQSLGRKLRHLFISEKSVSIESVFGEIINEVKEEWLSAINLLPDSEKKILRKNLMDGIQPDCAATVLIARLTISGDLKVYRTGDSKLLSFIKENGNLKVDTTLSVKNDVIGPVSFLLSLNKNKFDIIIRQSNPEITERTQIHSVIGYSDGIGKSTEKTLIRDYPVNPEIARTEIISQLQGTSDDKSMFIIEIKES